MARPVKATEAVTSHRKMLLLLQDMQVRAAVVQPQ
jgi:hypothetical protein